jgi:hypothetical protein
MIEYINGWEWLPLIICTMAGFVMIAFNKKGDIAFMGIVVLFMTIMLAHETHSNNLDKEFVFKRFTEGKVLKYGLWRGESILIDPKSGWRWKENIGFIKDDQIYNDLGVCSVIGEESPSPSIVPYAFVLLFELMLGFALRAVVQKEEGKNDECV